MKLTKAILSSSLILLLFAGPVMAWGEAGHETVGKIASLRIKRRTALKLSRILRPGDTLANMSTWADEVKDRVGEADPDSDTHAFLQDRQHNEKNREWHYVNLPLDCAGYAECRDFHLPNDIVHLINICIRTLQDRPDPNQPLSKRNALRLLIHLIGDMHQPLHIGAGFIDPGVSGETSRIERDPIKIKQQRLRHDRGGNQLIIDNDRQRLHSYWDFDLVRILMNHANRPSSESLGKYLRRTVAPASSWNPRGEVMTWAEQWATDSLRISGAQAYRHVRIVRQRTVPVLRDNVPVVRNGEPVMETVYDIARPAHYERVNREIARQQLAKAGYRLAKLLDEIL